MPGSNKELKTIKLSRMKKCNRNISKTITVAFLAMTLIVMSSNCVLAQDSAVAEVPAPAAPKKVFVKNTFDGNFLIDNQSVMVPIKGTFEFAINHRFGTTDHGFKDLFGMFASANMRLGFSYVPVKDLQFSFGANNYNMFLDWSAKYALLKQTKDNAMPVSVTLYANACMDPRKKNASLPIVTFSDRWIYFTQVLVARKFTTKFSAQVGISLSHDNNVDGYYDESNKILPKMKNDHLAFEAGLRYKISSKTSVIINYDQPLTQHPMENPHPNISVGLDMKSSGHDFQVFLGNYGYTIPQLNNYFNQNDYTKGQFVIGFNITRLWNF